MVITQRFTFANTLLIIASALCVLALAVSIVKNCPFLYKKATAYAITVMEESLGNKPLNPEHEQFIKNIAQEMGITRPITMRIMNTAAMQTFGYYNAFAAHHLFANIIPVVDTPFLFLSEDFFATVSPEEQRFLIGHELVHIQKQHLRYATPLMHLLDLMLLIFFWFFVRNWITLFVQKRIPQQLQALVKTIGILIALILFFLISEMIHFAYRRHIEWEADRISVNRLTTHQGGIKIMERWAAQYGQAADNPFGGLLSDHPSLAQRRTYFIEQQQLAKQITETQTV